MSNAKDSKATPLELGPGARAIATSPTLAIDELVAARRAERREVVHLGFGEASFPLHPVLSAALKNRVSSTGYGPVLGVPALRAAIAGYLTRERAIEMTEDRIIVGPGSKALIYALVHVLEGDVLLPVPSWVSYAPQVHLMGRQAVPVATDARDHHRVTVDALEAAMRDAAARGARPRMVILNSPNNPTGSMFDPGDVEAFAGWARRAGVTIISDEIYAELAHGWRAHVSPARFYPEGTIVTAGLSKSFSAGGWRLGYAALPKGRAGEELLGALRALASEIWTSVSRPIQEAAVEAFLPNDEITTYVRRSARLHGHVAGRLHRTLTTLGMLCPRPAGAFYLYPDFGPWRAALAKRGITTSADLAHALLDENGIATLPGTAFGDAPDALRLRLAISGLHADAGAPPAAREASLWKLLAEADSLPAADPASGTPLPLPALDRAEAALTKFVESLGTR